MLYIWEEHIVKNKQCLKGEVADKAHILDDPLGNHYDGLKVFFGHPMGPRAIQRSFMAL